MQKVRASRGKERNELSCRYLEGSGPVEINLMVDATNACQLRCKYCYYGKKGGESMDVRKVMAASKKMVSLFGSRARKVGIHYMGGEPLMAWDRMLDLNEMARRHFEETGIRFHWSMTSNLVGLTEKRAEHMIREKANIHCSIDGPADIHNRNRPFRNGRGSFDRVAKAIPLALQITPDDTARVTVRPEDARRMPEISEEIFGFGFETVGLFPSSGEMWNERSIEDWQVGISEAFSLTRKRHGKSKRISTIIKPVKRGAGNKNRFSYCGAGKGLWAIGVDGMLYFCHHMTNRPEMAIIDASSASSSEIRQAIENSTAPPRDLSISEECVECLARDFCNGGCWSDNMLSTGKAEGHDKNSCNLEVATVEAIGDQMQAGILAEKLSLCGDWEDCTSCYYCAQGECGCVRNDCDDKCIFTRMIGRLEARSSNIAVDDCNGCDGCQDCEGFCESPCDMSERPECGRCNYCDWGGQ